MKDPRWTKLATLLVEHSIGVKPGEIVLIETTDALAEFTALLIHAVADAGGLPMVVTNHQQVLRALYQCASEEQMKKIGEIEAAHPSGDAV